MKEPGMWEVPGEHVFSLALLSALVRKVSKKQTLCSLLQQQQQKKLLRVYPGTLGPCSKKETGLRPLQWGWESLAAKRAARGSHNAASGTGVRWADKPRLVEGQGTSWALGHLGEQEALLDWTLGSHGHLVGSCPEARHIGFHFSAKRKVGIRLSQAGAH